MLIEMLGPCGCVIGRLRGTLDTLAVMVLMTMQFTWVCAAAPNQTDKMNVLFVAVDDLTCSIGCYGDQRAVTPNFDAFFLLGARFLWFSSTRKTHL